jgi:hypothetical protein
MNRRCLPTCIPIAAVAVCLTIGARDARASQLDEQMSLTTAEQACLSGSYQRGVDILASLYIATRKPAYIHNQARCYEQNGQYEAALARYREFLRLAKELPPERRSQIEANMNRLEQAVVRQRNGAASPGALPPSAATAPPAAASATAALPGGYSGYPPPAPPTTIGTPGTPPTWPAARADVAAHRNRPAATVGNPALRIVGPVVAGAGGVLVLGAALAGLRANSLASEVSDDARRNQQYDASKFDSGKSAATLSTIGFIAGPVLIAGGALLYWLGLPKASPASRTSAPRSVALTPGFLPGGASVHLGVIY